jgi:hypothetical protein
MSDEVNMEGFQPSCGNLLPTDLRGEELERHISALSAATRGEASSEIETTNDAALDTGAAADPKIVEGLREFDRALSLETLRSLGVLWPAEVDRVCLADKRRRFLVEDLLPVESIGIVGGESTIGKSALICQLAICVAAGVQFLGMPTKKSRVLYFDLENSLADCRGMRDSLVGHLGIGAAPGDFLLVTDPYSDLENLLDKVRPELVVIDSLRAFRPDITEKPATTGEWLKEIRRLSHHYKCAFLVIHHLRKPSQASLFTQRLEDTKAADWLQQMEGPRALVNQTDVRIAVDEGDSNPVALKVKWSQRVYGDSPLLSVKRVFDDDDQPLGYQQLTGKEYLSPEKRAAFDKLPQDFATKDAKTALNRSDDPTNKFLGECKQLGLLQKVERGQWRKLPGSFW